MRTHASRNASLAAAAAALAFAPLDAWAYLDPGTGSMLLSVVVGLVSSAYFVARKLPSMIRSLVYRVSGRKDDLARNRIAVYSESKSYWTTWRPVLLALARRGAAVTYFTSAENDPVFDEAFQKECRGLVTARFIGTGNAAYTALGFLEADVFVLTTPGVDVLQIRRSPGVRRYAHVVHALGDIHTYKLYSFDYYDAVLCSGAAQARSLRALERIRGTAAKALPLVGCPYLDGLVERAKTLSGEPEKNTVIVAPTWGRNGMLTRCGSLVPRLLAEAGLHVILRPHPQSFISDKDVISAVEKDLAKFPNVEWDRNPDGFATLSRASVMVSDVSGVIFDFAFVFLRPVITIGDGPLRDGFEAWEIPHPAWETAAMDELGRRIRPGDEASVAQAVRALMEDDGSRRERILALREENAVNFGRAGEAVADEILRIEAAVSGASGDSKASGAVPAAAREMRHA